MSSSFQVAGEDDADASSFNSGNLPSNASTPARTAGDPAVRGSVRRGRLAHRHPTAQICLPRPVLDIRGPTWSASSSPSLSRILLPGPTLFSPLAPRPHLKIRIQRAGSTTTSPPERPDSRGDLATTPRPSHRFGCGTSPSPPSRVISPRPVASLFLVHPVLGALSRFPCLVPAAAESNSSLRDGFRLSNNPLVPLARVTIADKQPLSWDNHRRFRLFHFIQPCCFPLKAATATLPTNFW
ncbi:hypothetical protein BS78_07G132400 [Paspalum vaginatum]|nr:hypothetical protein BS78_07G132400 [Paspalum vaginatum]